MYDRIRRHRTLDQSKVYLNQNVGDANLTIQELKQAIYNGDANRIMKRMSAYSSNVTGSDSYWHKRRGELESTFEQKPPATVFFTMSYADNHWNDLHELMPRNFDNNQQNNNENQNEPNVLEDSISNNNETSDSNETQNDKAIRSQKYRDVLENPHLVDWYFGFRLNQFLEVVFDGVLECEWRWHRYEWQSRSSIHAHGAARFKNDPGLIDLTTKVYAGRLASKSIGAKVFENLDEIKKLENIIEEAIQAEEIVTNYADTLITAMNGKCINGSPLVAQVPDPHPCSLRTSKVPENDKEADYDELAGCCQRHLCSLEGYCKSKKAGIACRFGFPFKHREKTIIEFTETANSVRAEISLKRNDSFMNQHCRIVSNEWRANVDMQLILDHHAAINYMVKYATKGEKAGTEFTQMFKDVVGPASLDDNPQSKLRSIMVKSVAGKRDIGQCEVSRLILGEPMYHSSFNYIVLSTDFNSREVNLDKNIDENEPATKKSMLDFFGNRLKISQIRCQLINVKNLIDFARIFRIVKNELVLRNDTEKTVVITYPKVINF
jgi:hypothetical protein